MVWKFLFIYKLINSYKLRVWRLSHEIVDRKVSFDFVGRSFQNWIRIQKLMASQHSVHFRRH